MQGPGNQQNTAAGGPRAGPSVPGGPETLDFSLPTKTNKEMRINSVFMKGILFGSDMMKCISCILWKAFYFVCDHIGNRI